MPVVTQQAALPTSIVQSTMEKAAPVETPAVAEVQDETLSPRFAALARKEKALRAQAQQLKAKEDAWKAKEAEYESSYIKKDALKKRFAEDPMGIINEHGVSYDQLTNAILNQPSPQDIALKKLNAEIQAVKDAQAESVTKAQEQQKASYEQALNQIRNEAKILIDSDVAYETIKEMGAQEAVVELIKSTFEENGSLLSVEEASKEVEAYLLEQAIKMASLNKVKAKLLPEVEAPKLGMAPKVPMKTLTNAQSAPSKPMTAKEKRERAILAFKGQLS